MTSLSVIICTWNRADSLRATLASLEIQLATGHETVEVIVVDNNSTDNTAATVAQLAKGWKLGTLRYLFEGRQGKQFALNSGIAQSEGDLLAFTDDDVLFPSDWITCIFNAFEDARVEVAGGRTFLRWPEGGEPIWYAKNMEAVLGGLDLGENILLPPPSEYAPAGANLVARRSLFARVGVFSESHFRHMDFEFGQRCARQQAGLAYIPSLIVWAPIEAAVLSKRYFRRWSFKAGILHPDGENAAASMRVPRWVIRRLFQDVCNFAWEAFFKKQPEAFSRELRIWRALGAIASSWQASTRPHRYAEWVAHYSQKKNDLY